MANNNVRRLWFFVGELRDVKEIENGLPFQGKLFRGVVPETSSWKGYFQVRYSSPSGNLEVYGFPGEGNDGLERVIKSYQSLYPKDIVPKEK